MHYLFLPMSIFTIVMMLSACDNPVSQRIPQQAKEASPSAAQRFEGSSGVVNSSVIADPVPSSIDEASEMVATNPLVLDWQENIQSDGTGIAEAGPDASFPGRMPSFVQYDGDHITYTINGVTRTETLTQQQKGRQNLLLGRIDDRPSNDGNNLRVSLDGMSNAELEYYFENQGYSVTQVDNNHIELARSMNSLYGDGRRVELMYNTSTLEVESAEIYRDGVKVMGHMMQTGSSSVSRVQSTVELEDREEGVEIEAVLNAM